nr:MAG TPA_asm: hypothetical protein [Caudoviricetes sp.]
MTVCVYLTGTSCLPRSSTSHRGAGITSYPSPRKGGNANPTPTAGKRAMWMVDTSGRL